MLRIGICADPGFLPQAARAGFDYLETGLSSLAALEEGEFSKLRSLVSQSPIQIEACNVMLPGALKITGPGEDETALLKYVHHAFSRAASLGCRVVVMGSGGSRACPPGWPLSRAYAQLAKAALLAARAARAHGIALALEPLGRAECNVLNFVSEALILSSGCDALFVLGDTYHMAQNGEPMDMLRQAGDKLRHVHIAHPETRNYPLPGDGGGYEAVFAALAQGGYRGRVSIEGHSGDREEEGAAACRLLRALARDAGL